jgi:hypothetical protein
MTENRSRGAMDSGRAPHTPTLDELLAAAVCSAPLVPEAEERAVAAFRAARDARVPAAPTRREDDWRSVKPRLRAGWIKVGLGTLVAGLTLSGVAMVVGALPAPFGETPEKPAPAPSAPTRHGGESAHPSRTSEPAPSASGPAAGTPEERSPTAEGQATERLPPPAESGGRAGERRPYDPAHSGLAASPIRSGT